MPDKAPTPGHTGYDVGLLGSWFQTEAEGFADHHESHATYGR